MVTGGNRGIGFEISRQLSEMGINVILTARDQAKGKVACAQLDQQGNRVYFQELDVASPESIQQTISTINKEYGRLDILINNAGVFLDSSAGKSSVFKADLNLIKDTIT